MDSDKLFKGIILIIFSTVGSMVPGYITASTSIFQISSPDFQFIANGVFIGLFFSVIREKNIMTEFLTLAAAILVNLLIFTGSHIAISYILRDLFYMTGLYFAVKLYYLFIYNNPEKMLFLRAFVLALLNGIINVAVVCILGVINSKTTDLTGALIYLIGRWAVLIGLGSGMAIDLFLFFQMRKLKILSSNID